MISVYDGRCFWVCDGKILGNLKDFEWALKEMSDETFKYHANGEKKDFVKWVDEALSDGEAAKAIAKAKNRKEMLKEVKKILKDYDLS